MLPLMAAVGGVGAGAGAGLFLLQASVTVMTQPASNASAASNVKSRRVMVVVPFSGGVRSDMRILRADSRERGRQRARQVPSALHRTKGVVAAHRPRRL